VIGETAAPSDVLGTVRRYWGFNTLRPLQDEAIRAGLARRDSLVVMPTGGGKSLCYQVPPAVAERNDVVVSPLIALMKDQVDSLRACGYPAAASHSGIDSNERRAVEEGFASGEFRLLFVSPERLLTPGFIRLMERAQVGAFAIDEAHCISHWGHDFRKEYRELAALKDRFPEASVHAYTATATEQVRADIVQQLRLDNPAILVGRFDRPNLIYRIIPRVDADAQVLDVIRRHHKEAVIVYRISRKETESTAAFLKASGVIAEPYHAGLSPDIRRRIQDRFAREEIDVVVATVAFGMGIDRSNIRAVVHAGLPKSIEQYQQETGRAGRDGLDAECVLLYSAADPMKWESLLTKSAGEMDTPKEILDASLALLDQMRRFCAAPRCRHRALTLHFGQSYPSSDCGACDFCLGEITGLADATVIAQKILSCVARVDQRFGVGHVADVLHGAKTERITRFGHDRLSTHGLMKDILVRTPGDMPILKLNETSLEVMRGQLPVHLAEPQAARVKRTTTQVESWEGVDERLFEMLRQRRKQIALEQGVPPYVVFSDVSLRDMARIRPSSKETFLHVYGVGRRKLNEFAAPFLEVIDRHCAATGLDRDVDLPAPGPAGGAESLEDTLRPPIKMSAGKAKAFEMFANRRTIEEVMEALQRAASTAAGYLADFIELTKPQSIEAWVDADTYARVADAAEQHGTRRLKPIFDALDGQVPYETIRLVARHVEQR
jgi:ATP-dependent DNA helicase RecQ